jgi:cell envelope opacity-associated protein A
MTRKKVAGTNGSRHRCNTDKCRRLANGDDGLCLGCREVRAQEREARQLLELQEVDPNASAMETIDALRFAKIDTEIRNHLQGVQIAELEMKLVQTEMNEQVKRMRDVVAAKVAHRDQLNATVKSLRPAYDKLLRELAAKYGIADVSKMTIDADVGLIRELAD